MPNMKEYTPNTFLSLVPHVPCFLINYSNFIEGKVTWDEMLITTYNEFREQCLTYENCYIGIRIYPIFEAPLSTTDQSLIISCIICCLSFMEDQYKKTREERLQKLLRRDDN